MRPSRLGELLPNFDVEIVHTRRVGASPAAALEAARAATPGEMPLVRLLYALREAPALLTRGRGLRHEKGKPQWEQMLESGFVSLVDESDEIVLGYAGQPWKLAGLAGGRELGCGLGAFRGAGLRQGGDGLSSRSRRRRRAAHDRDACARDRRGCATALRPLLAGDPAR